VSRHTVDMMEVRRRLGDLVERVAHRGDSFAFQRRGRTMAVLVAPEALRQLEEAARRLRAIERPGSDVARQMSRAIRDMKRGKGPGVVRVVKQP
jgi:antitoxin (DNA-binding transcriptional repressor) of toxin-antitoxin stability system